MSASQLHALEITLKGTEVHPVGAGHLCYKLRLTNRWAAGAPPPPTGDQDTHCVKMAASGKCLRTRTHPSNARFQQMSCMWISICCFHLSLKLGTGMCLCSKTQAQKGPLMGFPALWLALSTPLGPPVVPSSWALLLDQALVVTPPDAGGQSE